VAGWVLAATNLKGVIETASSTYRTIRDVDIEANSPVSRKEEEQKVENILLVANPLRRNQFKQFVQIFAGSERHPAGGFDEEKKGSIQEMEEPLPVHSANDPVANMDSTNVPPMNRNERALPIRASVRTDTSANQKNRAPSDQRDNIAAPDRTLALGVLFPSVPTSFMGTKEDELLSVIVEDV